VLTLAIGTAIYLAVALLPENREDLRFSLRWIFAGGSFALLWGSLQAGYIIHYDPEWFNLLKEIQSYISIRPLHNDRIASLTFEPHWFADQILLLILPWSLAAVLTGHTVFRWRKRRLTIEWLLLGWSLLLLPFTFSRAGLLNMVVLIVLSVLFLRPLVKPHNSADLSPANRPRRISSPVMRRLLEFVLVLCVITLPVYFIGTKNLFFARIWEYWKNEEASLSGYISHLGFDARLTFSQAALRTYEAYPVLGVGLGNYAFYFQEMLPYRPIAEVPEAMFNITPRMGRERLITSKNFYLRLLSETGILGAITFLAFLIAILGCALFLWLSPDEEWRYWGTASLCGLIAFTLSAFTFDSFVIPNMWVVFGMITAATRVLSTSSTTAKERVRSTRPNSK
jgi:O-antigen ligase